MDDLKEKAIKRHLKAFAKSMDAEGVMDDLQFDLLELEDVENIRAEVTRRNKARKLIDILCRKREELKPFEKFEVALQRTGSDHALFAKDIRETYNELLIRSIDSADMTARASASTDTSKKSLKNAELARIQELLKEKYLTRFKTVNPFSLPFTFDIENTWVSLALKEDSTDAQATEDHAKVLERAFEKAKMLIIEGDPATGKTSLMQRLAYEWGKGKEELCHYDLVVYGEFRTVREQTFESIADLVLGCSKNYLDQEAYEILKKLVNNKQFYKENCLLVLLDGYDESTQNKQCSELSTYLFGKTCDELLFNVIITTRKGYLSNLRGYKGRFMFAEVLGFKTNEQKKKYIENHFSSVESSAKNIEAVHLLLDKNKNINKLAKTPLFLTFICLVHQRTVNGTILEMYCNIIWWFIDRHQKDFPDRDIPCLFEFQSNSEDKFETIENYYLQFPQLHCLGKMALKNLEKNVFEKSECKIFNLKPVLEEVGLLRKEKNRDASNRLTTHFFFPHRTIQEFLAAFSCFLAHGQSDDCFSSAYELNTNTINEYEEFLLRIALSDKMPITGERQKIYFEKIVILDLHLDFEDLNTTLGFNIKLLNRWFSQCSNIQVLKIGNNCKEIVLHEPINLSEMTKLIGFSFQRAVILLQAPASPTHINPIPRKPFLLLPEKKMKIILDNSTLKSAKQFTGLMESFFRYLVVGSTIEFKEVRVESDEQAFSFSSLFSTDDWSENWNDKTPGNFFIDNDLNDALRYAKNARDLKIFFHFTSDPTFQPMSEGFLFKYFGNLENLEISRIKISEGKLITFSGATKVETLTFEHCTFEAKAQVTFTNWSSLKALKFKRCEIKSSATLRLKAISNWNKSNMCKLTLEFEKCEIDLEAWHSIVDEIRVSNVQCLKLSSKIIMSSDKYLNLRPSCSNKQISNWLDPLQKCDNIKTIHISSDGMIWEYSIQLDIKEQLSLIDLKNLHTLTFGNCNFSAGSQISIANCPSMTTLEINYCNILTSTVLAFAELSTLDTLTFDHCTFEAKSMVFIRNCASLKFLKLIGCTISSSILDFANLPTIHTLELSDSKIDGEAWQSIKKEISESSVKYLKLPSHSLIKEKKIEIVNYIQKYGNIQAIEPVHGLCSSYDEELPVILQQLAQEVTGLHIKIKITISSLNIPEDQKLTLSNLINIHTLKFHKCTFNANARISLTECQSLKALQFVDCKIMSNANLVCATLSAIETLIFKSCALEGNTQNQSFVLLPKSKIDINFSNIEFKSAQLFNKSMKYLSRNLGDGSTIKFDEVSVTANKDNGFTFNMEDNAWRENSDQEPPPKLFGEQDLNESLNYAKYAKSLTIYYSEKLTDSISTKNFPTLQVLRLKKLKLSAYEKLSIEDLKNVDTLIISKCIFEGNSQVSFTNCPSLKTLKFIISKCIFEGNSQVSFTNCPSLKTLNFIECKIKDNSNLCFATLSEITNLRFSKCQIDLKAWESITNEIANITIHCLTMLLDYSVSEFLNHLSKCEYIEKIILGGLGTKIILKEELLSFTNLKNVHTLIIHGCSFEAKTKIVFTNCSSLITLQMRCCAIKSDTILGFAKLKPLNTLQFFYCDIEMEAWKSIIDEIRSSSIQCLGLTFDQFIEEEKSKFLNQLQNCECIENIQIASLVNEKNHFALCEEQLTKTLSQLAYEFKGLKVITFVEGIDGSRKMKENNMERILKDGQKRNRNFSIQTTTYDLSQLI